LDAGKGKGRGTITTSPKAVVPHSAGTVTTYNTPILYTTLYQFRVRVLGRCCRFLINGLYR